MDDGPEHRSQQTTQKKMLATKKLSSMLDSVAIFHRVAHGMH
jgi:hypothetical protein